MSRNKPRIESVEFVPYGHTCPCAFEYYDPSNNQSSSTFQATLPDSANFKFPFYNEDKKLVEEILVNHITEQLTVLDYNEYFVFNLGGQYVSFGVVKWGKDSRFSGTNLVTNELTSVDTSSTMYDFDAFMYIKSPITGGVLTTNKFSDILVKNKEWFEAFADEEMLNFTQSSDYNNLQAILLQQYYNEFKDKSGFPNLITSETLGIYKSFDENRGFILHSDEYRSHMQDVILGKLKNSTEFKFDYVGDQDVDNIDKYHGGL